MDYEQINQLIERSLLEVFYRDNLLLQRSVREECINHRLSFYFETLFSNIIHDDMHYSVDLEYNKNLHFGNKEIETAKNIILSIRPDIIIHKRDRNSENLLAVEAKLHNLTGHDTTKLNELLYDPYYYRFTAGIVYNLKRDYFTYTIFRLENNTVVSEKFKIIKQNANK